MHFMDVLQHDGAAEDRAGKMGLYGWLIGDWEMDATVFAGGVEHAGQGHIHFAWVLAGRAIQDVWILPGVFHGTTLRVYDPGLDAWHIVWSDPLRQYYCRQIGRADGKDIVQLGRNDAGEPTRWRFVDVTKNSFCWLGEKSPDGGKTWNLEARFFARRVHPPTRRPMLDHVSIGVRDLTESKRFYDAVLQALGCRLHYHDEAMLGYGANEPVLWLNRTDHPVPADPRSGLHFSLSAPSRESVDAFHSAAISHGGHDNGVPGLRPEYGVGYYAAFVIDPDGYRIEAHRQEQEE